MADPSPSEIRVNLPGASVPVTLPAGWSLETDASDMVTIVSPEEDLRAAFLVLPLHGEPEEVAQKAWQAFDSGFDLPVLQKRSMPGIGGWDSVFQIFYNVPEAQSRVVVAGLRMLGDSAYCTLVSGSKGSVSRRQMQLGDLVLNWKPDGLTQPSLASSQRRKWEEKQSAEMGEFLRRGMAELQIPGAAIAVVQGGQVVFAEGFGVTQIGWREYSMRQIPAA